ncbi:MAG: metallophosphoesterase family protein [Candidatus Syntropharchaeia archaeon]
MRIGVISDTHLIRKEDKLPEPVIDRLREVDLIVHCGDFEEVFALEEIKRIGPRVEAVCGNMDSAELKRILPKKKTIEAGGKKIGIIHGYGSPDGLEERIRSEFGDVDAILYGHSHIPRNEVIKGILFFNPGSPTDKKYAPYNSFGMVWINDRIKGEIIRV